MYARLINKWIDDQVFLRKYSDFIFWFHFIFSKSHPIFICASFGHFINAANERDKIADMEWVMTSPRYFVWFNTKTYTRTQTHRVTQQCVGVSSTGYYCASLKSKLHSLTSTFTYIYDTMRLRFACAAMNIYRIQLFWNRLLSNLSNATNDVTMCEFQFILHHVIQFDTNFLFGQFYNGGFFRIEGHTIACIVQVMNKLIMSFWNFETLLMSSRFIKCVHSINSIISNSVHISPYICIYMYIVHMWSVI